ncbi:MAG: homocysteine S-methyltransferase [Desulfobacterales bacterium]
MNPIEAILKEHPVVVLDGALATELERRGCDLNDPLWSARILLESPETIGQVHSDYFMAGADCAITATYQASVEGFVRRGLSHAAALDLMRKAVRLAVESRDAFWKRKENRIDRPRPFVAASIGPYGAFLADGSEYRGDYGLGESALIEFHRPRMEAVLDAGADILACETLPCLAEASALVKLLEDFPAASAWFSFSARDDAHISNGELIADCASFLDGHPRVAAVGVNCTAPAFVPGLIRNTRGATRKSILVYPNSGEAYDTTRRGWHGTAIHGAFADQARTWYAAGARIIGGCCRTTPEDIRDLAIWARGLRRNPGGGFNRE